MERLGRPREVVDRAAGAAVGDGEHDTIVLRAGTHEDATPAAGHLAPHAHELDEHEPECTGVEAHRRQAVLMVDHEIDTRAGNSTEEPSQAGEDGVHVEGLHAAIVAAAGNARLDPIGSDQSNP